ncbi:hypothetical protein G9F32_00725 [Acinetobacter sp. 194]|uniref:hypothetical protein n=1 Tax=Acinetobacter shaoyimingii TaxID=2715164 RepID=UPI001407DE03|nr:hypothetical protein [Acinetobacter shaoyimingii]NHB56561.1 hypothetical protein [Acinetobacter shaoyimingii]
MSNKVVLLDLENNVPSAQLFRDIFQHYSSLYIFNRQGKFELPLADLTEFATWVSSGQIVVLDTLTATEKEFEYAVIVGQLLALIDLDTHVELISSDESSQILMDMLIASGFNCSLIQVERDNSKEIKQKNIVPSVAKILANPQLTLVKKYCDILGKMSGKPNSIERLKNSLINTLQVEAEQSEHLVGMMINLKLVKCQDEHISFRKKVLKQWIQVDLTQDNIAKPAVASKLEKVDALLSKLQTSSQQILDDLQQQQSLQSIQSDLFKNFEKIDPVQMEVIQKLNQMKSKPKDIYELRDLLEQLFPKSDVRLLLKEMIDKGYIYWNGHSVIYSHEMFLN